MFGLPILLEIASKDVNACRNIYRASKPFHDKVHNENNGDNYYSILFEIHGIKNWDFHALHGNLNALKWLHKKRIPGYSRYNIESAAQNGHLHVVEWLCYTLPQRINNDAMNIAAQHGHLHVLKWLHEHQYDCTKDAIDLAAGNGHLEIVIWLLKNRKEGYTRKAIDIAAATGQFHVIKWLYQNRYTTTTRTWLAVHLARKNGHVDIAEWLMKNYPLDNHCLFTRMRGW